MKHKLKDIYSFFYRIFFIVLLIFSSTQFIIADMSQGQYSDYKSVKKTSSFNNLKVSGYIQAQYQQGEKDADLKVGSDNEIPEKSFSRFGIRRGRIKFVYEEKIASGVFQIDLSEKGVKLKDVYLNIKDPWMKTNAIRTGVFNRPFGHEITYSSSLRESPERSTIFQTLFPDGRDLGVMLILQPFKESPFRFFKFETGLFSGNGVSLDTDNRKDFIGHVDWDAYINMNFSLGMGMSYYIGGVYQGTDSVYRMSSNSFILDVDSSNKGKFAKREYMGFDIQMALSTKLGRTKLHAEYLFGQQPGNENSTYSPSGKLPDFNTYIRSFSGGYVMFVQSIGFSPFSVVVKYDWYDPNTKVSNDNVILSQITSADVMQNTLGMGVLWSIKINILLQAYYEINKYERFDLFPENESNTFTLRLQYKF